MAIFHSYVMLCYTETTIITSNIKSETPASAQKKKTYATYGGLLNEWYPQIIYS
jgi:hypothetical protein